MSERKRQIRVGFDLGKHDCQITYTENGMEMVSVSTVLGGESYQIPTRICKKNGTESWYIGQEAKRLSDSSEGVMVSNLYAKALDNETLQLENKEYPAVELLAVFLKKTLSILLSYVKKEEIAEIMFTVEKLDEKMVALWKKIKCNIAFDEEKLHIQSYDESLYWYQVQKKKLHKTLVVDYQKSHGVCRLLSVQEQKNTLYGSVALQNIEEPQTNDDYLLSLVQQTIGKQVVETIYLVGEAFEEKWYPETLKYLCKGRRVFLGQNLYTRGACFAAYMYQHPERDHFVFHSEYRVDFGVELDVLRMQKNVGVELLPYGSCWFDVEKEIEVLNDGMSEILFRIKDKNSMINEVTIPLSDMETRPEKSTKLNIRINCVTPGTCRIQIKDMGLGQIIPSSGKVWEKTITFQEMKGQK